MSNLAWIWLAGLVVFLILELATPTLIFACFVVGSLAAGILSLFMPEAYYGQIGMFVGVSVLLMPFTRLLAKKITKPSPQESNVAALIGKVGMVTKAIDKDLGGQIQVEGEVWIANADEDIAANTKAKVLSVSGTRLIVKKHE